MNRFAQLTVIMALVGGLALANGSMFKDGFAYSASTDKAVYGHFTLVVNDEFGNIQDYIEFDNVITDEGDDCIAVLAFGSTLGSGDCTEGIIDAIAIADCSADDICAAVGDATTAFDDSDSANIGDECDTAGEVTNVYTQSSGANKVRLTATFDTTETADPFTARQAGILNDCTDSTAPELFAIQNFSDVTISGSDTLTINYDVSFSG